MKISVAILGWFLTWFIIFGYGALGRVLTGKITGRSDGWLVAAGSVVGFIFGILVIGRYAPDETESWVSSYFQTIVFYFTTLNGILIIGGGFLGWWQLYRSNVGKGKAGSQAERDENL